MRREGGHETFRLDRVLGDSVELLESWSREQADRGAPRLEVDATEEGWLRFLEDGRLVILHPLEGRLRGAAGVWVGPGTGVAVRRLAYDFARERYQEKRQENEVFAKDSFMRHWSSPEGQWIAGADGLLWHKGDFFSDFSITMPCIAGGELHVGVPDDSAEGTVVGDRGAGQAEAPHRPCPDGTRRTTRLR